MINFETYHEVCRFNPRISASQRQTTPRRTAYSGRVYVHACARLVRAYFLDQFEVSFLPLARTFAPLIVIV
jgi:hypothetical protein